MRCWFTRKSARFRSSARRPSHATFTENGTKNGKRVQSNGGAKNYVVIMPDADPEHSVRGVIEAAFGCAGERCMAGSTAVVVGDAAKRFLPPLIDATKAITVGPTDTSSQPNMGPVITRQHADRIHELIEHGRSEGATIAADGRGVKIADAPNGFFVGATILDHVQPGTMVHHEEIFGPVLNVMRFDDLDAAIELANKSAYGNGASIFTRSGRAAREFKMRVKAGMVGINIGVPASMAWFPFNGWDDSFFGDLHMQGARGRAVFHPTESHDDAVVQPRRRQHLGGPVMRPEGCVAMWLLATLRCAFDTLRCA